MKFISIMAAALVAGVANAGSYGSSVSTGSSSASTESDYAAAPHQPVVAPVAPEVETTTCKKWCKSEAGTACKHGTHKKTKCTTAGSHDDYETCSEEVCCKPAPETPVAPIAPVTTPVAPVTPPVASVTPQVATVTIVDCANWCSSQGTQCQVTVKGACCVEGAYGAYSQCSKAVCCGTAAPVAPVAPATPPPTIVTCAQFCQANSFACQSTAAYGCSMGSPYGKYPTCSKELCCLYTPPSRPVYPVYPDHKSVNPCASCGNYCPSYCNPKPVNPCDGCTYCPKHCYNDNEYPDHPWYSYPSKPSHNDYPSKPSHNDYPSKPSYNDYPSKPSYNDYHSSDYQSSDYPSDSSSDYPTHGGSGHGGY